MGKPTITLAIVSLLMAVALVGGSTVLALPPQADAHAQASNANAGNVAGTNGPDSHPPATNGQTRLAAAQLKACQNRENAINNIMSRINTRAQNQLTLFGTIATRVENFYTSKGKTVSNYDQLTGAINSAKTQAQTDLTILQNNGTFNCDTNDPKGMVTAFQGYLKTEITDLQNYRTAVKNLIIAVAQANGATISGANQSTTQGGQQ